MATTKLILTHDVPNLGHAGEVVEVKAGYARNYLVPRGFAAKWTAGAQKQIDQIAAARRRHEIATIDDARAVRARPPGLPLSRSPARLATPAACSAPSPLLRSLTRSRSSWPDHRSSSRHHRLAHQGRWRLHGDRRPAPRGVREPQGPRFRREVKASRIG